MPRRVDKVERVALVLHLNSMALDGDAALLLQIHIVEHLILHLPNIHRIGELQQAVGYRRFTVVNMSNNAKISYLIHIYIVCVHAYAQNRLQNYEKNLNYANLNAIFCRKMSEKRLHLCHFAIKIWQIRFLFVPLHD